MSPNDIESLIEGVEKLRAFYKSWPCFHDAEIVELHLWQGYLYPGDWDDRNVFPVLTVKIRVLEATQPEASGAGNDVLVTLRFHSVEDLKMQDFNQSNSIVALSITKQARGHFTTGEELPPYLAVTFEPGFGLAAAFRCFRIEVLGAESAPEGPIGQPIP